MKKPNSPNFDDMEGRRFGRLVVTGYAGRGERGHSTRWECLCDCGQRRTVWRSSLTGGLTQSCGCLGRERRKASTVRHGLSKHPSYFVWASMVDRCANPGSAKWRNYGGRGIRVCERWMDLANFVADMGEPAFDGAQLDRIDNDGGYEPGNCRWASRKVQLRNTRSNSVLEYEGQVRCITEWAEIYGIPTPTLRQRLKRGWPAHQALTEPVHEKHRGKRSSQRRAP